jgi:3-oxoadipate enol-lactonase
LTLAVRDALLSTIHDRHPTNRRYRMFIQGLGCTAEVIWRSVMNELRKAGDSHGHIAFDARGVGSSTGFPESLEQLADDIATVATQLTPEPVQLIGHSLGGVLVPLVAARFPGLVDSVMLMDTAPVYGERARAGFLWRAESVRTSKKVESILDTILPRSFCEKTWTTRPDVIAPFRAMLAAQSPEVYVKLCELAATADARTQLSSLAAPALLIVGGEDSSTTPTSMQSFADALSAPLVVVPDSGHNPPIEQPAFVARSILEFAPRTRRLRRHIDGWHSP